MYFASYFAYQRRKSHMCSHDAGKVLGERFSVIETNWLPLRLARSDAYRRPGFEGTQLV
jgi:hypothetical protein